MNNKFASALKKDAPPTPAVPEAGRRTGGGRSGAKHIGGYFPPQVSQQLRRLAASEDTSVQNLLAEALDMLFESRRLPAIARPSD